MADKPKKEEPEAPAEVTPEAPVAEEPKEEPKAEPPVEEPAAEPQAEEPEPPEPELESEEPELTPRQQERVKEAKERGMDPLKIERLITNMTRPKQADEPSQKPEIDYSTELDADEEVVKTLEADRKQYGDRERNAGLEMAKNIQFHTRLEVDAPRVEQKYSFLDKNSSDFDPVRANAMNMLYLNTVGYSPGNPDRGAPESVVNPNVRYYDFVEAQMEFAEALMAERSVRSTRNIAKQAAETGLRPDGSSAKGLDLSKAPKDMSNEELNAALKIVVPLTK